MSAVRAFYGVLARPQSYLNLVYLFFAFPLGIFYFVFLVTGLSVGIATAIIWVGFLILAMVAGGWLLLAGFERWLTVAVLRQPMPEPLPRPAGSPRRIRVPGAPHARARGSRHLDQPPLSPQQVPAGHRLLRGRDLFVRGDRGLRRGSARRPVPRVAPRRLAHRTPDPPPHSWPRSGWRCSCRSPSTS